MQKLLLALTDTHNIYEEERFWFDLSIVYTRPECLNYYLCNFGAIRLVQKNCSHLSKTFNFLAEKYALVYYLRDTLYEQFGVIVNLSAVYRLYQSYLRSTLIFSEV